MPDIVVAIIIVLLAIILPFGIPAAMTWWELRQEAPRVPASEFWEHDCGSDGTRWAVAKGSPCTWCGRTEAGSSATESTERAHLKAS